LGFVLGGERKLDRSAALLEKVKFSGYLWNKCIVKVLVSIHKPPDLRYSP